MHLLKSLYNIEIFRNKIIIKFYLLKLKASTTVSLCVSVHIYCVTFTTYL